METKLKYEFTGDVVNYILNALNRDQIKEGDIDIVASLDIEISETQDTLTQLQGLGA